MEIKNIDIKTNYMDYLFYLENGEYLHFEFQSTNKKDDIKRFLYYDASLFFRDRKKIRTIVVYSSEIENTEEFLDAGTIKYSINPFYMSKIDGDEKLVYIEEKIKNNEFLNKEDILTLTFIPLMRAKKSKSKFKELITMTEIGKMIREEGLEEGKKEGKSEIIIKLLIRKFKELPEEYMDKIKSLSDETLETIVTDIFDMESTEDLKKYF